MSGSVSKASEERPFAQALMRLRQVGLRPTRQRLALARLLFDGPPRHLTAETLHGQARAAGIRVSLATIYNTLHQFTEAGLLSRVLVEGTKTYFDTNTTDHHHFYVEDEGMLVDIPAGGISVEGLPAPPPGLERRRVEVVVRLGRKRPV